MEGFTFSVPQDIVAGKGSIAKLPEVVKKMGAAHAFIISGVQTLFLAYMWL